MADVKLRWLGTTSSERTNNGIYSVVGWTDSGKPVVISNTGNLLFDEVAGQGSNWELVSAIGSTVLYP